MRPQLIIFLLITTIINCPAYLNGMSSEDSNSANTSISVSNGTIKTALIENAPIQSATFKGAVTVNNPSEQNITQTIIHKKENGLSLSDLAEHTKNSIWSAYDQILTSVIATLIIKAGEKTVYATYNYIYDYIYKDPTDLKLAKESLADAIKILQRINLMQNTDTGIMMQLIQGYQNATVRSLEHAIKYAKKYPRDESSNAQLEEALSSQKTNVCVLQNESCKRFSALLGELAITNSQKYLTSAPTSQQPEMFKNQKFAQFELIQNTPKEQIVSANNNQPETKE